MASGSTTTSPDEWNELRIGDLASYIARGINPVYSTDGIPVINQRCIRNGIIHPEFIKFHKKTKKDIGEKILHTGDILINSTGTGTAGRVAYFDLDGNMTVDSHITILRCNDDIDPVFVFYHLRGREDELESICKGSTGQIELGKDQVRQLELKVPNRATQDIITQILSALDKKIGLLRRQNITLGTMAETLFKQRFVEEAKKDWEEKCLLEGIVLTVGGTPKTDVPEYWEGNIKWLSGGDIASNHKGFVTQTQRSITQYGLQNSSAKLLPKFATTISARGTVGKYCLLSEPMAFSQSNYGILPKFRNCFFFSFLLIGHIVEELQAAAYGSVFDTITTNTFKEYKIQLPEADYIQRFEDEVAIFFEKILSNTLQIATLIELRDSLLGLLVSGEIRVKTNPHQLKGKVNNG